MVLAGSHLEDFRGALGELVLPDAHAVALLGIALIPCPLCTAVLFRLAAALVRLRFGRGAILVDTSSPLVACAGDDPAAAEAIALVSALVMDVADELVDVKEECPDGAHLCVKAPSLYSI
jgi:hypothetical protein